MNIDLKKIIFLDIETVAAVKSYSLLSQRMKDLWTHKASLLKNEEKRSAEELFASRAGIYAEFGKVVAIVAGAVIEKNNATTLRIKTLSNDNEKELLTDFKKLTESRGNYLLCAHNGKEFDFPYLCRRMLVHEIPLPKILELSGLKPWNNPHLDTLELWKFGDHKNYTSLDLMAALFDIPTSKEGMDGSMVNAEYYEKNNLEGIAKYCAADVVALAQVYLKLTAQKTIDASLIEYV